MEKIVELGLAFRASKTLLSAVELGLFTELAGGPLQEEALRQRLGLHERGAEDFFDGLVALGMLERHDGRYSNTAAAARYLDRNQPAYIGGLLEFANSRLYPAWGSLTAALRTGKPQSGLADSEGLFDAEYRDPAAVARYARAMTGASLPVAQALARHFAWDEVRTFIDIGAAQGAVPVTVAAAHPHLSGGGFDLPLLQPVFDEYVCRHQLADRLRFWPGDFFRDALPTADVLVMGHILHDWDLREKQLLLEKAHRALERGGALIVYDQMIDDERRTHADGLLMSLNMLVRTQGGFDYTGVDCIRWMQEAGFARVQRRRLGGPFSMVTGFKA